MSTLPPVITIDGPSGSGKGTIAQLLASELGWHYLDSGAIYRAIAWAILDQGVDLTDHERLAALVKATSIEMQVKARGEAARIVVNNQDVTENIRAVVCSQMASKASALPFVREALMDKQCQMRQLPGLVTDGRDMGTVVFPDADVKFYFEASVEERAKRRFKQLKERGNHVSLPELEGELRARDERDRGRQTAPLKPAEDAIIVDTSTQGIEVVFQLVLSHVRQKLSSGA